jgi:hypothetical protein
MEIRGEGPKIPEELQRKLSDALFEFCIFCHKNGGLSQVILTINHVSDALAKRSNTIVTAMGTGLPIEKAADQAPKNKEQVDKLVAELMAKAKENAAQQPKQEPPKPDQPNV